MAHDTNAQILTGIKAYLRTHFPDVEFTAKDHATAESVIFQGDGHPRYRLEVTGRFLEGEVGAAKSLGRLQEWNVAAILREAKSKLVTLATTGVHTNERGQAVPRPPRRHS